MSKAMKSKTSRPTANKLLVCRRRAHLVEVGFLFCGQRVLKKQDGAILCVFVERQDALACS